MWFVVKGWLGSDDPAVLDHALHAHNTRVDRGNPAIAVLSIGYQSLGSCSRAAGWSAATLCTGPSRTSPSCRPTSAFDRYCCKSRKSISLKNIAEVDFWTSPPLHCLSTPVRRSGIDLG